MNKLKTLLLLLPAFFLVNACDDQPEQAEEEPLEAVTTVGEEAAPNTLSDAESQQGWKLLFTGENLDGWHSFQRDSVAGWTVEDGTIVLTGGGGDLVSDQEYGDFELTLDWKIEDGGNSGVIYRVVEDPKYSATYVTGPEYQLLDDEGFPQELKPNQYAGSNYDMHAPEEKATKPAGEWNQTKIIVDDGHVEHWLNGKKVVEYELGSENWQLRVNTSKWKDHPDYGKAESGKIALQDHGNTVWFRNIKIREL